MSNSEEYLQTRLRMLELDFKDSTDPKVLARWPNLGSTQLKYELQMRIEEVKRMIDNGEAPPLLIRDRVVEAVRDDLLRRSQLGIKKYGATLERTDLTLKDWLQHAYEETLDQANYLKRAIISIEQHQQE